MDWDGVGTFALFIASGAVGVTLAFVRAYKAKLAAGLERERIRAARGEESGELRERLATVETQLDRLHERLDFTERLLGSDDRAASGTGPQIGSGDVSGPD
ncbi:MAG: hypothetical protein OEO23_05170 [Gemmatimonadota bacterium]|nr:hypothetical protein [Gemmatimonadota bacterium]